MSARSRAAGAPDGEVGELQSRIAMLEQELVEAKKQQVKAAAQQRAAAQQKRKDKQRDMDKQKSAASRLPFGVAAYGGPRRRPRGKRPGSKYEAPPSPSKAEGRQQPGPPSPRRPASPATNTAVSERGGRQLSPSKRWEKQMASQLEQKVPDEPGEGAAEPQEAPPVEATATEQLYSAIAALQEIFLRSVQVEPSLGEKVDQVEAHLADHIKQAAQLRQAVARATLALGRPQRLAQRAQHPERPVDAKTDEPLGEEFGEGMSEEEKGKALAALAQENAKLRGLIKRLMVAGPKAAARRERQADQRMQAAGVDPDAPEGGAEADGGPEAEEEAAAAEAGEDEGEEDAEAELRRAKKQAKQMEKALRFMRGQLRELAGENAELVASLAAQGAQLQTVQTAADTDARRVELLRGQLQLLRQNPPPEPAQEESDAEEATDELGDADQQDCRRPPSRSEPGAAAAAAGGGEEESQRGEEEGVDRLPAIEQPPSRRRRPKSTRSNGSKPAAGSKNADAPLSSRPQTAGGSGAGAQAVRPPASPRRPASGAQRRRPATRGRQQRGKPSVQDLTDRLEAVSRELEQSHDRQAELEVQLLVARQQAQSRHGLLAAVRAEAAPDVEGAPDDEGAAEEEAGAADAAGPESTGRPDAALVEGTGSDNDSLQSHLEAAAERLLDADDESKQAGSDEEGAGTEQGRQSGRDGEAGGGSPDSAEDLDVPAASGEEAEAEAEAEAVAAEAGGKGELEGFKDQLAGLVDLLHRRVAGLERLAGRAVGAQATGHGAVSGAIGPLETTIQSSLKGADPIKVVIKQLEAAEIGVEDEPGAAKRGQGARRKPAGKARRSRSRRRGAAKGSRRSRARRHPPADEVDEDFGPFDDTVAAEDDEEGGGRAAGTAPQPLQPPPGRRPTSAGSREGERFGGRDRGGAAAADDPEDPLAEFHGAGDTLYRGLPGRLPLLEPHEWRGFGQPQPPEEAQVVDVVLCVQADVPETVSVDGLEETGPITASLVVTGRLAGGAAPVGWPDGAPTTGFFRTEQPLQAASDSAADLRAAAREVLLPALRLWPGRQALPAARLQWLLLEHSTVVMQAADEAELQGLSEADFAPPPPSPAGETADRGGAAFGAKPGGEAGPDAYELVDEEEGEGPRGDEQEEAEEERAVHEPPQAVRPPGAGSAGPRPSAGTPVVDMQRVQAPVVDEDGRQTGRCLPLLIRVLRTPESLDAADQQGADQVPADGPTSTARPRTAQPRDWRDRNGAGEGGDEAVTATYTFEAVGLSRGYDALVAACASAARARSDGRLLAELPAGLRLDFRGRIRVELSPALARGEGRLLERVLQSLVVQGPVDGARLMDGVPAPPAEQIVLLPVV